MKRLLLFIAVVLFYKPMVTADPTATFIQVWGFLKYYHPAVAGSTTDWDQVFQQRLETLQKLSTAQQQDSFYLAWLQELGPVKPCKSCLQHVPDSLKMNLDESWMHNPIFSSKLQSQFQWIAANPHQGKSRYVGQYPAGHAYLRNEKIYPEAAYPGSTLRLLALARFWNFVNYFYPYKYTIEEDWSTVLDRMVPLFREAPDTLSYHKALQLLTASLHDSHANFSTPEIRRHRGKKTVPVLIQLFPDQAVIWAYRNDSLAAINGLQIGDVILKIDGEPVSSVFERWKPYEGASNEAVLLRDIGTYLLSGNNDTVLLTLRRGTALIEKKVQRYPYSSFSRFSPQRKAWILRSDSIGYINLGVLKRRDVNKCLRELWPSKAIILDIRNYPQGTVFKLVNRLSDQRRPFARFTYPDLKYPGVIKWSSHTAMAGKKNRKPYKGQVVLVFNSTTQSGAEFSCMAYETIPGIITVGSQTAGADGNVTLFTFPGGYTTYISGIGVYYPDGRATQRKGIIPQVPVQVIPTDVIQSSDPWMDKAYEVLRNTRQ